jgi:hypothetical protein
MKRFFLPVILVASFSLSVLGSCIGISSEITLRRNGSGTVRLEYRFSRELESLGKLDGNKEWPPVPVGRADFERTVARVPGLALKSFKSAVEGNDAVYHVTLSFADTDALIRFLDASGQKASLSRENGRARLSLVLADGYDGIDPSLGELVATACRGYFLTLDFSLPAKAELTLTDGSGRRIDPPQGWKLAGGSRSSFSAPMGEILLFDGPLCLETTWDF